MIDLYTWPTPNGRKVSIALEEMGLAYRCHAVNLQEQEQFHPNFLAISPNNKIPAIVDQDTGQSLMESGAYSIADVAIWPWVSRFEWQGIDLADFANVKRWYEVIALRPAVQMGYDQPMYMNDIPKA